VPLHNTTRRIIQTNRISHPGGYHPLSKEVRLNASKPASGFQLLTGKDIPPQKLPQKSDIAEYLGMHSFYDDIVPGSQYGGLLDQPIRTTMGKAVKPNRITLSGEPVLREAVPVFDKFLEDINQGGLLSLGR